LAPKSRRVVCIFAELIIIRVRDLANGRERSALHADEHVAVHVTGAIGEDEQCNERRASGV
jgi:hypothetical protein